MTTSFNLKNNNKQTKKLSTLSHCQAPAAVHALFQTFWILYKETRLLSPLVIQMPTLS